MGFYFLVKDLLSRPVAGFVPRLLFFPLTALAWLYGRILSARRWGYRSGLFHAYRPGVPVISVGNVTAGGTGKTPCVEAVCRVLLEAGIQPAVLSRGCGSRTGRPWLAVSEGEGPLVASSEGGDEPLLLAQRLPGVPILVGRDRRLTAREAVGRYGAQALVLDDGFQHLALARDLDIVAVDVTNPLGNGYPFPRGLLRESPSALSDADLLLLTRAGRVDPRRVEGVKRLVRKNNRHSPVLVSSHDAVRLTELDSGVCRPLGDLSGLKVLAFAGIASPSSFFQELELLGARVVETVPFPDHHRYSAEDVRKLTEWAQLMNAQAVLTTEKDAVRLTPFLPFAVQGLSLGIELRIVEGAETFRSKILECVQRAGGRGSPPNRQPRRVCPCLLSKAGAADTPAPRRRPAGSR